MWMCGCVTEGTEELKQKKNHGRGENEDVEEVTEIE